jgi:hypothetical protein
VALRVRESGVEPRSHFVEQVEVGRRREQLRGGAQGRESALELGPLGLDPRNPRAQFRLRHHAADREIDRPAALLVQ